MKDRRPSIFAEPPEEFKAFLRRTASNDQAVARAARLELAVALQDQLRKGILAGDVLDRIYEPIRLEPDAAPEFPLDILAPGVEKEHVAYTIPGHGYIPERCIEGDYIMVPTYEVGNAIDWPLKLARNARWDIVGRALQVFDAGFVKKDNDDGWHVILKAGADRGIYAFDEYAGAGRLSLRLLSAMKQAMRRNAGGNSTSLVRGIMTDIYMSIELAEGMREWTVAEIDETTRREIFTSTNGYISEIFGIRIHELTEFGVNQEYQNFFLDDNGANGTLISGDVEVLVGLDLQQNDSFINPIRQELEVFEDDNLHRQRRAGVYGWKEHGFSCLDQRRVVLGSA